METIAQRLKESRENINISQAELSRRSKVKKVTISKIEAGGTDMPRLATLNALANSLGVSRVWLLFGPDDSTKCTCEEKKHS